MRVQKIANYEQRLRAYRSDCKRFWRGEFLWMGTTAFIIVFGFIGYLNSKGAHFPLDLDWKVIAAAFWVVLMIPPVAMMHPKKPHPDDVLRDQELRRAFNMDDTVSKEI